MAAHRKVTDKDVTAIRIQYDNSNHRALAERYGVSITTIYDIVNYRRFAQIAPAPHEITYTISKGRL